MPLRPSASRHARRQLNHIAVNRNPEPHPLPPTLGPVQPAARFRHRPQHHTAWTVRHTQAAYTQPPLPIPHLTDQVLYSLLLDSVAAAGYTAVATPYAVTFRHDDCARAVRQQFLDSLQELRTAGGGRWADLAPEVGTLVVVEAVVWVREVSSASWTW